MTEYWCCLLPNQKQKKSGSHQATKIKEEKRCRCVRWCVCVAPAGMTSLNFIRKNENHFVFRTGIFIYIFSWKKKGIQRLRALAERKIKENPWQSMWRRNSLNVTTPNKIVDIERSWKQISLNLRFASDNLQIFNARNPTAFTMFATQKIREPFNNLCRRWYSLFPNEWKLFRCTEIRIYTTKILKYPKSLPQLIS